LNEQLIKKLVDQYIEINISIEKNAGQLIKGQMCGDVTSDQHYMLRYINNAEVCTSTELAETFNVNKSAITAIINRLWEKGLIQRNRDEKDRRVVYLTLTEEGKNLFNETESRIHQLVGSFIKQFDRAEIESFMKTYEKLNKIILATKDLKVEE